MPCLWLAPGAAQVPWVWCRCSERLEGVPRLRQGSGIGPRIAQIALMGPRLARSGVVIAFFGERVRGRIAAPSRPAAPAECTRATNPEAGLLRGNGSATILTL